LGWDDAKPVPHHPAPLPPDDARFDDTLGFPFSFFVHVYLTMFVTTLTWALLAGYGGLIFYLVRQTTPQKVSAPGFFEGQSQSGQAPGLWLLVASAAISWIFAKSIDNAASLGNAFGIWGGIGYALYYLSFVTAAIALYFIRTRGGYRSIPEFLASKYGILCSRLFLIAIAIRLINEVWSNTKVFSLYFGSEGSWAYWLAALVVTRLHRVLQPVGGPAQQSAYRWCPDATSGCTPGGDSQYPRSRIGPAGFSRSSMPTRGWRD
jgi:hypothetical protein